MARDLRSKDPERFHLVTIRTEQQCFFLRPSKDVNKIVGGVIARYQEIFQVELYALTVLSNHFHLISRAPLGNLDEFMENVDRELARRLNYKIQRRGKFWSRRYRAQLIPNDADLEEAFLYVTTNSVKHGLVKNPADWPGISSCQQSLGEKPSAYPFYHYSEVEKEKKKTYHMLKIIPLPAYKDLPEKERIKKLGDLIEDRTRRLVAERESRGVGFASAEIIKEVSPFDKPRTENTSPTSSCYSKNLETIRKYRKIEAQKRSSYALASMRYRMGDLTVVFPEFTFKPPVHRFPRLKRFTPLPSDYFLLTCN